MFLLSTFKAPGAHGYFLGGYVLPKTPNWHLVLKKISPKIDTPVLEMGQFFIPRFRIHTKIDTPFRKWAHFLYSILESFQIEIALFFFFKLTFLYLFDLYIKYQ